MLLLMSMGRDYVSMSIGIWSPEEMIPTKLSYPSPIILLATEMPLLTGPPDSTGGCQSALVNELGVIPSRYHHNTVHIEISRG
jgi:hypothetical protein